VPGLAGFLARFSWDAVGIFHSIDVLEDFPVIEVVRFFIEGRYAPYVGVYLLILFKCSNLEIYAPD
jgi:hypothetical protein